MMTESARHPAELDTLSISFLINPPFHFALRASSGATTLLSDKRRRGENAFLRYRGRGATRSRCAISS